MIKYSPGPRFHIPISESLPLHPYIVYVDEKHVFVKVPDEAKEDQPNWPSMFKNELKDEDCLIYIANKKHWRLKRQAFLEAQRLLHFLFPCVRAKRARDDGTQTSTTPATTTPTQPQQSEEQWAISGCALCTDHGGEFHCTQCGLQVQLKIIRPVRQRAILRRASVTEAERPCVHCRQQL